MITTLNFNRDFNTSLAPSYNLCDPAVQHCHLSETVYKIRTRIIDIVTDQLLVLLRRFSCCVILLSVSRATRVKYSPFLQGTDSSFVNNWSPNVKEALHIIQPEWGGKLVGGLTQSKLLGTYLNKNGKNLMVWLYETIEVCRSWTLSHVQGLIGGNIEVCVGMEKVW